MPLYEYKCKKCGRKDVKLLEVSKRNEPQKCSLCGGVLERTIPNIKLAFKGAGWTPKFYR